MNTTNASWMTPFAQNYYQLAASALLGWQKANPDVPVSELPDRDAFREITGLDREAKPSRASFHALQGFWGLKVNQDGELPAAFEGAWEMVLPPGRLNREAKNVCRQMLQGANDLFNVMYPKVKARHEILSFRQDDDAARQVAGDYLQHHLLLPEDGLRGELIQLIKGCPRDSGSNQKTLVETRRNEIVGQLRRKLEKEFYFAFAFYSPKVFNNGAPGAVVLALSQVISKQALVTFFSSEHSRFVEGVLLNWERPGQESLSYLETFLECPLVRSLQWLRLPAGLGFGAAYAVARSPFLSNLTSLDFHDNQIGDAGVKAITESPFLSNLTELHLSHDQIGVEATALIEKRWPGATIWK